MTDQREAQREHRKGDPMITVKSQFVQHILTAVTLALVLGALSMIWPAIIAVFLSILRLLQSFSTEREVAVQSWDEVGNVSVVIDTVRHPALPSLLL
jgi:hypothetical protein